MGDNFLSQKVRTGSSACAVTINDSPGRLSRLTRKYTPVMRVDTIILIFTSLFCPFLDLGYAPTRLVEHAYRMIFEGGSGTDLSLEKP